MCGKALFLNMGVALHASIWRSRNNVFFGGKRVRSVFRWAS
jgi:hypothetical protein